MLLGMRSFIKPLPKVSFKRKPYIPVCCATPHPDDNIPYVDKYPESALARSTVTHLSIIYDISHRIDNEFLADVIYDKWNKYHKLELKDINGSIHLIVNHSFHIHKFIAANNYDKVVKRLNALHMSYHVVRYLLSTEFPSNSKPITINLGVSSYIPDPRNDEWYL